MEDPLLSANRGYFTHFVGKRDLNNIVGVVLSATSRGCLQHTPFLNFYNGNNFYNSIFTNFPAENQISGLLQTKGLPRTPYPFLGHLFLSYSWHSKDFQELPHIPLLGTATWQPTLYAHVKETIIVLKTYS